MYNLLSRPGKFTTVVLSFWESFGREKTDTAGNGQQSLWQGLWISEGLEFSKNALLDLLNQNPQDCSLSSCIWRKHCDGWFWRRVMVEDPYSEVYFYNIILYNFQQTLFFNLLMWCITLIDLRILKESLFLWPLPSSVNHQNLSCVQWKSNILKLSTTELWRKKKKT